MPDAILLPVPLDADPVAVADAARFAEAAGFDGIAVPEAAHDPLVGLSLAAAGTSRITLATTVLIALARNPMTVAVSAADLHNASGGRFVLGLGSQVKPHIERRFGMQWSCPADRMRDFVLAVRAIWHAFDTGRLNYRGEFYQHTLLTPAFSPGPSPVGRPPIWLAGVGPAMTAVAGEVADGFVLHPFTTRAYVEEVSVPALDGGAARAGRNRSAVAVAAAPLVALQGADPVADQAALAAVRGQLAFYGSTPAYRPVLELGGWGGIGDALSAAARRGDWARLADLVPDEMLHAFAGVGTPADVAGWMRRTFGGVADVLSFSTPYRARPELLTDLLAALRR
jgi:probable F420-dependent oxidoreductase